MKVSIEISKTDIKRAAYMFMVELKEEKDMETVNEVLAALEDEGNITITDDILGDQRDQIKLVFAVAAITAKIGNMNENGHSNQLQKDVNYNDSCQLCYHNKRDMAGVIAEGIAKQTMKALDRKFEKEVKELTEEGSPAGLGGIQVVSVD